MHAQSAQQCRRGRGRTAVIEMMTARAARLTVLVQYLDAQLSRIALRREICVCRVLNIRNPVAVLRKLADHSRRYVAVAAPAMLVSRFPGAFFYCCLQLAPTMRSNKLRALPPALYSRPLRLRAAVIASAHRAACSAASIVRSCHCGVLARFMCAARAAARTGGT
eukprot:IDg17481t1